MTDSSAAPVYCANHPNRETSLRCNRCEKPICPQCAVLTPTGYRCRECVHEHRKAFETARWYDYPLSVGIAMTLSYVGSLLAARIGFFTLLLAPGAGVLIATILQTVLQRRRSRLLYNAATVAVALGSAPYLILALWVTLAAFSQGSFAGIFTLLWQGVYAFVVTSTVYYRLSGIQLRR